MPDASLHELLHQNQMRSRAARTACASDSHGVSVTSAKSCPSSQRNATTASEADTSLKEPLEQYKAKVLQLEIKRLKLKVSRGGALERNDRKTGHMELIRKYRNGRDGGSTAPPVDVVGRSSVAARVQPVQNALGNTMEPVDDIATR